MAEGKERHTRLWQPVMAGLLILLLAAVTRLPDLALFSGPDEYFWVRCSGLFFLSLSSGDPSLACQTDHPGVTLMEIESLGLAAQTTYHRLTAVPITDLQAFLLPEKMELLSMTMLGERKFVIALFNALMVVVISAAMWKTFDGWSASLCGVLLALDPFVLAESRALHPEALLAGFGLLAVLLLLLYLRSGSRRHLLLAGLLAGLTLLSKINGVVLVPVAGLVILVAGIRRGGDLRGRLGLAARDFALWLLVTAATIFILWPALWTNPGQVYSHFSEYTGFAVAGESEQNDTFLLGRVVPGKTALVFYPLILLFRSSPLPLLGALVALVVSAVSLWRAKMGQGAREKEIGSFNVAVLFVYLLLYLAMMTPADKKVDRYILLPIFALDAIAGVGLVWLGRWIMSNVKKGGEKLAFAGLAAVTLIQGATSYPHHPYYYTYYNPLLGGPTGAVQSVPVGFGEGIDRAIAYLNAKPDAASLSLVCGTNQVRCTSLFAGQTLDRDAFSGEWITADYVLLYVDQVQREQYPSGLLKYLERSGPEYLVRLHGVDYVWVYKVPEVQHFGGGGSLEGEGLLLGYNLGAPQVAAGEGLPLHIYWESLSSGEGDPFFVRLLDERGYIWAETVSSPAAGFGEAARTRHAIVESDALLTVPPGTPPGTYYLRFGFYDPRRRETVGEFTLPPGQGAVSVVKGKATAAPDIRHPLALDLGAGLSLLGYDLEKEQVAPGQPLWLTLYWSAGREAVPGVKVGLRLLSPDGKEVATWAGEPLQGRYPTTEWGEGEVVKDPWPLTMPEGIEPGDYTLEIGPVGGGAWNRLGVLSVVGHISRFDLPVMQHQAGARLGEEAELLGYDLEVELPAQGKDGANKTDVRLRVTLYWRALRAVDRRCTAFVRLLGADGQTLAEEMSEPAGGSLPTTAWQQGEVVEDKHELLLSQMTPGVYNLQVGLYDQSNGERLPVVSGEGEALGDRFSIEDLLSKAQVRLAQ